MNEPNINPFKKFQQHQEEAVEPNIYILDNESTSYDLESAAYDAGCSADEAKVYSFLYKHKWQSYTYNQVAEQCRIHADKEEQQWKAASRILNNLVKKKLGIIALELKKDKKITNAYKYCPEKKELMRLKTNKVIVISRLILDLLTNVEDELTQTEVINYIKDYLVGVKIQYVVDSLYFLEQSGQIEILTGAHNRKFHYIIEDVDSAEVSRKSEELRDDPRLIAYFMHS